MQNPDDQAELQNLISALCVGVTCLLIYQLSRKFLDEIESLVLTIFFTFGSSLISTNGTALWTTDYLVIIYLCVILLLYSEDNLKNLKKPVIIGVLLFLAFLCRPTAAIFIGISLLYLFFENRHYFWFTAISSFVLLCGLIVFSLNEYNTILPPYYLLYHQITLNKFVGLYGILFSPSRGLFIYSPFLILPLFGVFYFRKQLFSNPFFWFGFCWFLLHTITISGWSNWWGGHSFGSRLMADVIPALLIVSLFVFREINNFPSTILMKTWILVFSILGTLGILINTYSGLFNSNSLFWNVVADVNNTQEYLLSWKYPQLFANNNMLIDIEYYRRRKETSKLIKTLQFYRLGKLIFPNDDNALYFGWYEPENFGEYRWSSRKEATILLKFDDDTIRNYKSFDLILKVGVVYPKKAYLEINNYGMGDISSAYDGENKVLTFNIDRSILKSNLVEIKFIIPDKSPYNKINSQSSDGRNLGIRLFSLKIVENEE
jgi:4-amino-4-deoxy-L-arabinose transferase-like glycosyltransferase